MSWTKQNGRLVAHFHFKSFVETLDFVLRVGNLAEQTNHHPNFHIYYNEVVLELWTHDEQKITEKDWALSKAISLLP